MKVEKFIITYIEKFAVSMPREKVPEIRLTALLAIEYPVVTIDGDKVNFAYDYAPAWIARKWR